MCVCVRIVFLLLVFGEIEVAVDGSGGTMTIGQDLLGFHVDIISNNFVVGNSFYFVI